MSLHMMSLTKKCVLPVLLNMSSHATHSKIKLVKILLKYLYYGEKSKVQIGLRLLYFWLNKWVATLVFHYKNCLLLCALPPLKIYIPNTDTPCIERLVQRYLDANVGHFQYF